MTTATTIDAAVLDTNELEAFAAVLTDDERASLGTRFPRLTPIDALAVLTQRPDATDVRSYVGWLYAGRRVRHGEHGIALAPRRDGTPRARVFDVDQTDEDPDAVPAPRADADPASWQTAPGSVGQHATNPAGSGMTLATCSYSEFQPAMGVPVRFTAGHPFRMRLNYKIAGHAKLISPTRDMLSLDEAAYTYAYLQILGRAGVEAIRAELATIAGPDARVVLLCFERLNEKGKHAGPNWCHRSLFAAHWQQYTGEAVPELGKLPASGRPYLPAAFAGTPTPPPTPGPDQPGLF